MARFQGDINHFEPAPVTITLPVLLAPMATMLRDRTGQLSLSTSSMRSIMDSIGGRLDEARDTGRYLVGLLVFLGLLGTFWGLLDTIHSVGGTINALDTKGTDSVLMFEELKTGLSGPLRGMGTAFSQLAWEHVLRTLRTRLWTGGGPFYVSGAAKSFDANGRPNDELAKKIADYMAAFVASLG